ncbi:dihydroneopterin aldolase [Ramlibacter sp.]|jgi:dihydroneopterin aldolase|uniref:dihydroneopterin aldolase n=1 Tax=Ramlibacter sp. TaxID=1917967 RepID=UPI0026178AC9|nr:dihydroneopterin aldolase [Ramlibacter sp.]MDB5955962.1 dihydroneopterin aldolase-like protein [Ramlibacter sp.]
MFHALADPAEARAWTPAESEPLDLVFLEGFTAETVIGIHDSELHVPQPITLDVCAGLPRGRACESDCIAHTLDYGELHARLLRLLREHRVQLLEALAEQVARIVLDEFKAHWVRVRIAKPRKFADTAAVGVTIERRRTLPPAAAARVATLRLIGHGLVPGSR